MYLSASRSTMGFAFAVTDAADDIKTAKSPLLDQLIDMFAQGSEGSAWIERGSNVYLALYVDGPGSKLQLVMANSVVDAKGNAAPLGETKHAVVDVSWDLVGLGLMRLFNGAWHHVAIILRSENAQIKAQLVLDGVTSMTKGSWNLCVPRKPLPIYDISATLIPVKDEASDRVFTSGMLVAGYLDGGVSKVEFYPAVRDIFDTWLTATPAVREFNAIHASKYAALGIILIIVGVVLVGVMVATSGREIWTAKQEMSIFKAKRSFRSFANLWLRHPKDANGIDYGPVSWGAAKMILHLDDDTLFTFVEEIAVVHEHPQNELVRLLYVFAENGHGPLDAPQLDAPQPLVEQWDERVVQFAKQLDTKLEPDPEDISLMMKKNRRRHSIVGEDKDVAALSARGDGAAVVSGELHFGGTQEVSTSQQGDQNVAVGEVSELKQLIMPILTVLQNVYVWLSTTMIPEAYRVNFGTFFSVIAADITAAFSAIPPVATPLCQMCLGMILVSALYYYLHLDERRFLRYIGLYVLRRDATDEGGAREMDQEAAEHEWTTSDRETTLLHINALSIHDAQRVDRMIGRSGNRRTVVHEERIVLSAASGGSEALEVQCTQSSSDSHSLQATVANCAAFGCQTRNCVLRDVGRYCARHVERPLGSQYQTDLWPFENAPKCALVFAGVPCGVSTGKMYVCGMHEVNTAAGGHHEKTTCNYALCEKHIRADPLDLLHADLLSFRRSVLADGPLLFMTIALFLANAFYTPVLKTAVMILGCHPYFQCLFPTCWSPINRDYALAVLLSLVIIFFFGIGFPLVLTVLLRRRFTHISKIFFSPCYEGRYGSQASDVELTEWMRFAATDQTALGALYKSYELEWIYLPPILLAWKVVLLLPPLFAESGSFEQSIGIAIVEFCYGISFFS